MNLPTTIDSCDHALFELDGLMSFHKWQYDHIEQQLKLVRNQINITRNQMNEIEQRKKELCDTNQMDTQLSSESCLNQTSNDAKPVVDALDEAQVYMSADLRKTLND